MPVMFDQVQVNGNTPGIYTGSSRPTGSPSGTGNPVMGDPLQACALTSIQAVNAATADTSIALPLGARILSITTLVAVAATGAASGLSVGSTVGGSDIVANTSVLGTTQVILPMALNAARPLLVANFASIAASSAGGSVIWVRNTQTTPTAVGTFLLFIEYVMV